ncbi:DUF6435 family protein [Kiritimatiellaeota bacterium B1221]|nr:DUF6435 family protein [Kiritimatiellaeota bacterium B1221]
MSIFNKKNPTDKLRTQYKKLMEQAMLAQRGGDIVKSSELNAEAEKLLKEIDAQP